jgi:hypothetical protein
MILAERHHHLYFLPLGDSQAQASEFQGPGEAKITGLQNRRYEDPTRTGQNQVPGTVLFAVAALGGGGVSR